MGTYAQSSIEITCTNNKVAREVKKAILAKEKEKKDKEDGWNYAVESCEVSGEFVLVNKSSGRIQNLEYQCEELWETIKNLKGVIEMTCPVLAEADGCYFSNSIN